MKILHITNAFPYEEYSSYGIFIKEQIESLTNKGLKCEVIFINARKNGLLEYFRQYSKVKKKIKDYKPDIIHVHHEFSLIPLMFLIRKKPLILSLLGDINKRGFLNKIIYKILSLKADIVVFKNELPKKENHRYLPNGVNTELFKPIKRDVAKERLGLSADKKYILFVSASLNNPIKRYDKYRAVVSNLNNTFGNVEELLMTNIPRNETPYYFNACDFLLITSDHEGSPNAVKESLSCNIPVVSTNVGNVKQMLENSTGSFVAKGNSVDELYNLSVKVLSNESKINERNLIFRHNLSIETIANTLIEIYKDLCYD